MTHGRQPLKGAYSSRAPLFRAKLLRFIRRICGGILMGRLRSLLVRAAFVLFGRKVFLLSKTDHAEPGFRHITPHALVRRIFGALGPSAAFCGVGTVLVCLTDDPGHYGGLSFCFDSR
jgi:hypothetical protein